MTNFDKKQDEFVKKQKEKSENNLKIKPIRATFTPNELNEHKDGKMLGPKILTFLEEFQKCFDKEKARKACGLKKPYLARELLREPVKAAMARIEMAKLKAITLTGEKAIADLLELEEWVLSHRDSAEKISDVCSLANSLLGINTQKLKITKATEPDININTTNNQAVIIINRGAYDDNKKKEIEYEPKD